EEREALLERVRRVLEEARPPRGELLRARELAGESRRIGRVDELQVGRRLRRAALPEHEHRVDVAREAGRLDVVERRARADPADAELRAREEVPVVGVLEGACFRRERARALA